MIKAAVTIQLSALDGDNGFRLDGAPGDYSGDHGASAGDVNGDGFADLIIGGYFADPHGEKSGSSYVLFGRNGTFASTISLSDIDGNNGFRLDGVSAGDYSGTCVASAGDINGDGYDDVIVGAKYADPHGKLYVVFGKSGGFASSIALSSLNGSNGFRIDGPANERIAGSVNSAGDINGDGFDDLIVGSESANGSSYVMFGKNMGFASSFNASSLNGTTGFRIQGVSSNYGRQIETAVASAGDINGDGFDDLLIGAAQADPNGRESGSSFVVFGKSGLFASTVSLTSLNGSNGFRIDGLSAFEESGYAVSSAGDMNGDGFDDLIIGAFGAQPHGFNSGSSYVVFGKSSGFPSSISLSSLNGNNGFRFDGAIAEDRNGFSVASAGDINGDGFTDIIIGAHGADLNGDFSGASYVVFGKSGGFDAVIAPSGLDGTNGFRIDGVLAGDSSGRSVAAAGDINNDGFDDLLIGAGVADPNGDLSGSHYVLFGRETFAFSGLANGTVLSDSIEGTHYADELRGFAANDTLAGGAGADTLNGGGGVDTADYRAGDAVHINLARGTAQLGAAGDVLISCEQIYGSRTGGDLLVGTKVIDRLEGFGGKDRLDGGQGTDILSGGGGGDRLIGRAGGDSLNGASGNDVLNGGSGNDRMTGGDGIDKFAFDIAGFGNDNVADFQDGIDLLWFKRSVADSFADFAIAGNGTTDVTVSVLGNAGQAIALHGSGSITLTAADFAFFA